jgi:hypothetical protein
MAEPQPRMGPVPIPPPPPQPNARRSGDPATPTKTGSRAAGTALLLAAPAVVIALVYLLPYLTGRFAYPIGADTPKYLWRTTLAEAHGLHAIGSFPFAFDPNADRPGFPALLSVLHAATGSSPFRILYVLPTVISIGIGLGAGAFAVRALREPRWAFPIYAVAVGTSVAVAQTARGRQDNLMTDLLVMGVAALLVSVATGAGGTAACVLLLGASTVFHWSLTALFGALVVVFGLALLPGSIRSARDEGVPLLRTPSGRLGLMLGGGALLGGVGLVMGPSLPYRVPENSEPSLVQRIFTLLVPVHIPTIVVASASAIWAVLSPSSDRRRRWGLLFAGIWGAMGLVAIGIDQLVRLSQPSYRFLGFALGIPILVGTAFSGITRATLEDLNLRGRRVGLALVFGGLFVFVGISFAWWTSNVPKIHSRELHQMALASAYVHTLPKGTPVVYRYSLRRGPGVDSVVRALLPVGQIARTALYEGHADDLLSGRPTRFPSGSVAQDDSKVTWPIVQPMLAHNPAILELSSINVTMSPLPPGGTALSKGVHVLRGPKPTGRLDVAPIPDPPSPWALVEATVALLLLLGAVGLGWSCSLVSGSMLVRLSLAVALGVGMLAIAAVFADRFGFRVAGHQGGVLLLGVAAAGWAPALVRVTRRAFEARSSRALRPG